HDIVVVRLIYFISSRSRHTRSKRDWSSDVCSSDLQECARAFAAEDHLVFACGRYEGIDHRVGEHFSGQCRVYELSMGDFVLNGGEIAAVAMMEAVVRLLPGFMGNTESLAEESHGTDGLLEYPVFTKPARWRGLTVPDVLLSGDHARIHDWRRRQARDRTEQRRPDLRSPNPEQTRSEQTSSEQSSRDDV